MSKEKIHVTIQGRVQGVGFRFSTIRQAQKIGVTGYVKNLYNGDVEVEAEGEKDQLNQLISFLKKGPSTARVSNINVDWMDYDGEYDNFSVKY